MHPIKVKVFASATHNINQPSELQINAWLAEHDNVEIVHLLQSESMIAVRENQVEHNLSITIFYRES